MAYTPTEWQENDLILANRMNKIEQGIAQAYTSADEQHQVLQAEIAQAKSELESDISQVQTSLASDINSINTTVSAIQTEMANKIFSNDIEQAIVLTQAEYDAMTAAGETTLYLIPEEE